MSEPSEQPDPAAVFACALSLWNACQQSASIDARLNLSDSYQGIDNLMRVVMSIGTRFEAWACENIAFDELVEVWPYLLDANSVRFVSAPFVLRRSASSMTTIAYASPSFFAFP